VRRAPFTACAAAALLLGAAPADAARKYPMQIVGSFDRPTYATTPPKGDKRLFVVERGGAIRVVRHGKILKRPFLNIRRKTLASRSDQRGMFSMAFAPDYARSRRFYVMYVRTGDVVVVDEFRRSKKHVWRAAAGSRRNVLTIGKAGIFHHGGQLQFGRDGMLWVSTGVSDHPEWAQDMRNLHGKILRIDPRPSGGRPYTVPPDNPFALAVGIRPEIWASGLRNPWRFSFDRRNGAMAIGDVGVNSYEEVDFLPAGASGGSNFGFPRYEGRHQMEPGPPPVNYVPPVIEHSHKAGFCAVMGGYVVRDRSLRGLYGRYLYGDNCRGTLHSAILRRDGSRKRRLVQRFGGLVSFGEDNRGHIYLTTNYGRVYRMLPR